MLATPHLVKEACTYLTKGLATVLLRQPCRMLGGHFLQHIYYVTSNRSLFYFAATNVLSPQQTADPMIKIERQSPPPTFNPPSLLIDLPSPVQLPNRGEPKVKVEVEPVYLWDHTYNRHPDREHNSRAIAKGMGSSTMDNFASREDPIISMDSTINNETEAPEIKRESPIFFESLLNVGDVMENSISQEIPVKSISNLNESNEETLEGINREMATKSQNFIDSILNSGVTFDTAETDVKIEVDQTETMENEDYLEMIKSFTQEFMDSSNEESSNSNRAARELNEKSEDSLNKSKESEERPINSKEGSKESKQKYKGPKHKSNSRKQLRKCPKSFSNNENRQARIPAHKREKSFFCHVCNKSFSRIQNFNVHKRTHTSERPKCKFCQKTFSKWFLVKVHERSHTKEKPYLCSTCNKAFPYAASRNRHQLIHQRGEAKTRGLGQPVKEKDQSNNLDMEQKEQSSNQFLCHVCNKCFVTKKTLAAHARVHLGPHGQFLCHTCGNRFNSKQNLESHQRTHLDKAGKAEKSFICHICSKALSTEKTLRAHLRTHSGEKPFSCDICQSKFAHRDSLRVHKRAHNNIKYHCPKCNKAFNYYAGMKRHLALHEGGAAKFTCTVCQRSFSQKVNLQKHELIHSGRRPYSCPVCQQSFVQKTNLKNHEMLHSGEKPFSCDICQKAFIQKSNLKAHMKRCKGGQIY